MTVGDTTGSEDVTSSDPVSTFRTDVELYDADGFRVHHLHAAAHLAGINTRRHIGWHLMGMLPPPSGLFDGRPVWRESDVIAKQGVLL